MSAWGLSWLIAFPTLLIALPMVPCIMGLLFECLRSSPLFSIAVGGSVKSVGKTPVWPSAGHANGDCGGWSLVAKTKLHYLPPRVR